MSSFHFAKRDHAMHIAMEVQTYAHDNYNEDGWDWIYETYTIPELTDEIVEANIHTVKEAVHHFRELAKLLKEREDEIRSTAF